MSTGQPSTTPKRRRVCDDDWQTMRPSRQSWNQRYAAPNDQLAAGLLPFPAPGNAPGPPFPHNILPPPPMLGVPPPLNPLPPNNFPLTSNDSPADWSQFYHSANANNATNVSVPAPAPAPLHQVDRRSQPPPHHRDHNFRPQQSQPLPMHSSYHQPTNTAYHSGSNYSAQPRRGASANNDTRVDSPRARQHSASSPQNLRIRQITPIRDALDSFEDHSALIGKFSAFLSESGRSMPVNQRRKVILDFAGFNSKKRLPFDVLISLNKGDLDNLAWALGLSRSGRKMDLAQRIGESLRAPLAWRTPTIRRHLGTAAHRRANGFNPPQSQPASHGGLYGQQQQQQAHAVRNQAGNVGGPPSAMAGNGNRGSMPALNSYSPYGRRSARTFSNAMGSAPGQVARGPSRKRPKDIPAILRDEEFLFPENPFNVPLRRPLGNPSFALFTAQDLSNGQNEPVLTFVTPSTSDLTDIEDKGDVQIHLRCLRVEASKPVPHWKQSWPFPVSGKVNGTQVPLNQAQRYTNGKLAGTDRATNILPYLRSKNKGAENNVTLRRQTSTAATAQGHFILFAQQILVRNSATMEAIVRDHSRQFWAQQRRERIAKGMDPNTSDFEMARLGVVEFLTGSDDVAMESMKVSLKCPLSLLHISIPVKGKDCAHIQCFDLSSYLDYARRSSKFNCPVCNKLSATPSALIICPYLEHMLALFPNSEDVEISSDGSMVALQTKRKGVASDTDDDDDDDDMPLVEKRNSIKSANGGGPARKKPVPVVVDLTLDSDEEEEAHTPGTTTAAESVGNQEAYVGNGNAGMENNNEEWNAHNEVQDDHTPAVTFETTFQADGDFFPWGDDSEQESSGDNNGRGSAPRQGASGPGSSNGASEGALNRGQYGVLDSIFPGGHSSTATVNNHGWSNTDVISIDSD